ncbi:hypothetical protein BB558_007398 [Smittium angustum]|uniref:Uncharacterized protein n=1 Tax=Smittium angustum TaxID=133377 RepID=A0A2U1IV49_SMIAN|nr:hypothetical protein BB558_007398 [Smittium angustum]
MRSPDVKSESETTKIEFGKDEFRISEDDSSEPVSCAEEIKNESKDSTPKIIELRNKRLETKISKNERFTDLISDKIKVIEGNSYFEPKKTLKENKGVRMDTGFALKSMYMSIKEKINNMQEEMFFDDLEFRNGETFNHQDVSQSLDTSFDAIEEDWTPIRNIKSENGKLDIEKVKINNIDLWIQNTIPKKSVLLKRNRPRFYNKKHKLKSSDESENESDYFYKIKPNSSRQKYLKRLKGDNDSLNIYQRSSSAIVPEKVDMKTLDHFLGKHKSESIKKIHCNPICINTSDTDHKYKSADENILFGYNLFLPRKSTKSGFINLNIHNNPQNSLAYPRDSENQLTDNKGVSAVVDNRNYLSLIPSSTNNNGVDRIYKHKTLTPKCPVLLKKTHNEIGLTSNQALSSSGDVSYFNTSKTADISDEDSDVESCIETIF